ncbi:MAG: beta-galactosidase [Chthoniobacterales bacterium]|nr:beta-galactosidase [Chthoniobacterales bacterium]
MKSACPFLPREDRSGKAGWRAVAFALFSIMALLAPGRAASASVPQGVFSLSPAGVACKASILTNLNVDGVSIRQDWSDLEPTEGVYDWSFLDSEVARVAAAGKSVLLRINTQFAKPEWVTAAVTKAGGSFFTWDKDGVPTTIPVFWDPTFLAKKKAMIAALGAHFTVNPSIKIVWTSFANANSEDWSVPHTPADIAAWQAVGYTTEKLLDAGRQIIDASMSAFPNQYVTLAVAGNGNLDPDVNYAARNAVLAARATWPGRLIVQKNSLATYNPPAPGTGTVFQLLWDSRPDIGGQMLDACFGDTTYRNNAGVADDPGVILHKSVNLGASYGMKYIEIYQLDVLNLPVEITYAHNVLLGLAPPTATPPPPAAPPTAPTGLRVQEP